MPVIPAASLIVYRAAAGCGSPELLIVERAPTLAFGGGALVFPGGRVEDDDRALVADGDGPEDGAARVAAIRETLEETQVAAGLLPLPDRALIERLRAEMTEGVAFSTLLARHRLRLATGRLTAFSRWQPPPGVISRVFDTRFYLAEAAPGTPARADGGESRTAEWRTAQSLLHDHAAGRADLLFPTFCHLHRIARHADFAAARADAAAFGAELIVTGSEQIDGTTWLTVPDGLGYPVTRQRLTDVRRS